MSRILQSRPLFHLSKNSRPFCSNVSASPSKPIFSSASLLNDQPPTSTTTTPNTTEKKSWGFVNFGIFGPLTGVLQLLVMLLNAYSLEEVDNRTKPFREPANFTVGGDASTLDGFTEPSSDKLLPDLHPLEKGLDYVRTVKTAPEGLTHQYQKCLEKHVSTLVLDLNETLIYSDWKHDRGWRTFKRPGVDVFLEHLAQFYEIIVYSDQRSTYVDPIIERLDNKGCIQYRLSWSTTRYQDRKHYRDFSKLNRDPSRILYVSGHALESSLQPENCVPIKPWKLESDDTVLLDLIPFLEYMARHRSDDIRPVLASYQGCDITTEFIERSKEHQRLQLLSSDTELNSIFCMNRCVKTTTNYSHSYRSGPSNQPMGGLFDRLSPNSDT